MKLILFALITASDDASQLVHDALANHSTLGYVVAGLAAVLLLLPFVLKALGKNVPFLDVITEGVVQLLKGLLTPPPKPTPEEVAKADADRKAAEAAAPGVEAVAKVIELKPPEQK